MVLERPETGAYLPALSGSRPVLRRLRPHGTGQPPLDPFRLLLPRPLKGRLQLSSDRALDAVGV